MFLQNHTKLINSFRHRKSINCFTSNLNNVNILALRFLKFRIKKKHKFLSNSRSVFKINFNRDFLYGTSLPFN